MKRGKICASVYAPTVELLRRRTKEAISYGSDRIELRIDLLGQMDVAPIGRIIHEINGNCILTCRSRDHGGAYDGDVESKIRLLASLTKYHPEFIDLEMEVVTGTKKGIIKQFRSSGISVILSHHILDHTPDRSSLFEIYRKAKVGDLVKIVTKANKIADNYESLSLYGRAEKGKLVAFCMGAYGSLSRLLALSYGSPFAYASIPGLETAKGQIPIPQLRELYDLIQ
ncbi:MAG: type I 3-dehydroquinate dehydratase [Nitrososphaerales archaeon]